MVTVVQVDRDLIPAKRRRGIWQIVSEADDRGLAVLVKTLRGRVLTVEAPDVRLSIIRVELMEAGPGNQFIGKVGWRKLCPALVWSAGGFTCCDVRKFLWRRAQRMVIRRERSRELIHEWMVGRTWPGGLYAKNRLCDCLKAKCLARIQHGWG